MPRLNSLRAFAARRLTPDRVRFYCLSVLAVNALLLAAHFVTDDRHQNLAGHALGGDFAQFYVGATIFLEHSPGRIYDPDLNDQLFHELLPGEDAQASLPYLYPPFFILLFLPLALLPYPLAYFLWTATSAALYASGFLLAWRATGSIPRELKTTALLLALAFVPFTMYCLLGGQVSTFGFFWLALAIHLEARGRGFVAGLALSLLLYKPPLLFLIVPMLLVTRRFRMFLGLAAGGAALAAVSVSVVGWRGGLDYLSLLSLVNRAVNAQDTVYQTWKYVDVGAFLRLLLAGQPAVAAALKAVFVSAALVALLIFWWRLGRSPLTWALAITWMLCVNIYVPVYDTSLVALSALITADELYRRSPRLPWPFKILLVALFVVPWFTVQLALATGLQLFTLVIAAYGLYQLSLAWSGGGAPAGVAGDAERVRV